MFAVIKTGGKQYKVSAAEKITVMSLPGEAGSQVVFDQVLALFDGEINHVGAPHLISMVTPQARQTSTHAHWPATAPPRPTWAKQSRASALIITPKGT